MDAGVYPRSWEHESADPGLRRGERFDCGRLRGAIERLIPALARRFGIPGDSLASHRDYAATSCPGANLYVDCRASGR